MEGMTLVKTDKQVLLNLQYMRWIAFDGQCFEVCTKSNGCHKFKDTHGICKLNSPDSFAKIEELYKSVK